MIVMKKTNPFSCALKFLPFDKVKILEKIPENAKLEAREIRLRMNAPLMLTLANKNVFVDENSIISEKPVHNAVLINRADLEETFKYLCKGSVYNHKEEIKNGFIRMPFGCRAGICGRISGENLSEITSINIRIAREILGAADDVVKAYDGGGVLIAGAPASGKTTVLRDLIRQLSSGATGKIHRISVVDSRGELSAAGECGNESDLGFSSDVLLCYEKAKGIEIAVRTLNPEIVAFDEISSSEELKKISEGFHSGVNFLTTAHVGSLTELKTRAVTKELLTMGVIRTVVFLNGVGERVQILRANQL